MDSPSPPQAGTESATVKAMAVADFLKQLKFDADFRDLVDEEGFATTTLQVFKDLIPRFEKLIKKRSWVRVENFEVQLKKIPYDKGDAPVVIVLSKDSVNRADREEMVFAVVVRDGGAQVMRKQKTIFHIDIVDGVTTDDKEIVVFMSGCEDDRNYILSEFRKKRYAMFILKSLFSGVYDSKRSLQFRTSTIIAPVHDEDRIKHLQNVSDFWRVKYATRTEVARYLSFCSVGRSFYLGCSECAAHVHDIDPLTVHLETTEHYCPRCVAIVHLQFVPYLVGAIENRETYVRLSVMNDWVGRPLDIEEAINSYFENNRKEFYKKLNTTRVYGHYKIDDAHVVVDCNGLHLKRPRVDQLSQEESSTLS
ncbi:hypothetical protein GOP47_0028902 [Adiantum capillus-veneris]|nr:hypothetical protein GOP47_0028902 [Adiantum capillus-veneris]